MTLPSPFLPWGRDVVNAVAARIESEVPGAHRGNEAHLAGYESLYVHFRDVHVPQRLAVWLYAAEAGTANNVRGRGDVIGVGLKHDADVELVAGAWRFRLPSPLRWQTHIDDRSAGYRWLVETRELPVAPSSAADTIAARLLSSLRRAKAVP